MRSFVCLTLPVSKLLALNSTLGNAKQGKEEKSSTLSGQGICEIKKYNTKTNDTKNKVLD